MEIRFIGADGIYATLVKFRAKDFVVDLSFIIKETTPVPCDLARPPAVLKLSTAE